MNENLNSPAQGTIEIASNIRIAWAATAERADQYYSKMSDESGYSTFMFVIFR